MKKRFFAMLLGTIVLFNTVGSDFVSLAEGVIEETESVENTDTAGETNEYEEAAVEEVEEAAEEVIQEVLEDDNDLDNEGKLDGDEQDKENAGDDELSGEEKDSEEELANEDSDEDVSDEEASDEELTDDELLDDEELDDELLEEEIEEEEEEEEVPFEQAKTVSGVRITLTAAEGVLPEGAYFNAKEIEDVSSIEDAVEKELTDSQKITEVKAFDITLYDADENEIQPDTSKGEVKVKFTNIDTSEAKSNDNVDMEVFHVADDASSATEMGTYVGNDEVSFNTEHFSTYAVVSIEDKKADEELDEWALVDSVVVKNGETVLNSGDAVSFSDGLSVTYNFKSGIVVSSTTEDYSDEDNYIVIQSKKTYKLPSIDVSSLNLTGSLTSSVDLKDEDAGTTTHIGDIAIDTDGNVTLELASGIADDTQLSIDAFVVSFSLNSTKLAEATYYELNVGNKTYTFEISDNTAEAPSMTTSGEVTEGTDTVTWTTTITNAKVPEDYSASGYTFVGVLDANQVLDKDSIKIIVNGTELTIDSNRLTISTDPTGTTITYVLNGDEVDKTSEGTTTITYSADVDFLGNGGAAEASSKRTVTNDVRIATSAEATDSIASANGSATATATKTIASLTKAINNESGKFTKNDSDQGVGEWSITVNTNGYALRNLIIYDYMVLGENTSDYEFTLDESSVVVTKKSKDDTEATTLTKGTDYKLVTESSSNYTWYVQIESASAGDEFVITYKTLLSNYTKYLRTNHTVAPYNTAFMTYYYEKGSDNWVEVEGPTMKVASKITTNAGISVSTGTSSKYDPATHQITWTVTVNQEAQGLTGAKILDEIPSNQTYVSSNIKEVVSDATIIKDGNNITFDIGSAANGKNITFTVVTQLTDDQVDIWSKNTSKTYYNPFTLTANELSADGLTVTANCTYVSEVIDLTAGNYNYDTHEIEYTVVVNDNLMLMTGISVADDLSSAGIELVDGSVELNGNTISSTATTGSRYTYSSDGKLVVYIDDVDSNEVGNSSAKSTITFRAKVTDGKLLDVTKNTQDVSIKNTANLYTDAYSEGTIAESDSASTTFTNNIVLKSATIDQTNLSADYVVTFNANQIELPSKLLITDTLGASMDLDISSVKVYIGTVNASTGEIISSGTEETGYTISTTVNDAGRTVLTIKLAEKTGNTNAYYITYSATAIDFSADDYGNAVSISGYTNAVISAVNVEAKVLASVSGNASKLAKIVITNVDKEDNNVTLANSTFVIKDEDGNVIRTVVTKSDGTAKAIGGKIKNNTTYVVTQISVQDGYVLESDPFEVTVSSNSGTYTFENPKLSKEIIISKEDGSGNKVSGAGLEITWIDSQNNTIIADSRTSGDDAYSFIASYNTIYTLTETSVPFGYQQADAIKFKIVDGQLYQYVDGDWTATDSIVMIDAPLDSLEFSVSKVSASQGNELTGATLLISKESTLEAAKSNYIDKWTSDGVAKEFAFPAGTYYLYELSAPTGYTVAESIAFKIVEDGDSLKLQLADENGDFVDAESTNIVMTDDYDEDVTYTITFSPTTLNMTSEMFSEMKFQLYTLDPINGELVLVEPETTQTDDPTSGDPTSDDPTSDEPTTDNPTSEEPSTDDSTTTELTYKLNYQQEYILKPTGSIEGYDPVAPITIKVTNDGTLVAKTLDSDTFTETNLVELGETVTPKLTAVIEEPTEEPQETPTEEPTNDPQETPSETPAETPATGPAEEPTEVPAEVPAEITDVVSEEKKEELAEETSENNTGSSNGGSGVRVATGNVADTALELKENVIEATADLQTNDDSVEMNSGARLAQTGGFIGTLISYLFALFAIAAGLFLVFGKEKRAK